MYGIPEKSYQLILLALEKIQEIESASIYGSRAIGNYKDGSDIDLVVYGENINNQILLRLKTELEHKQPIPYFFDVTHYDTLENTELKKHIDTYAKIIFQR
ncbi:MAG: nucleotidyltransferase domain-containing protein [Prolixibacteraceae bacterium]|nr:nucleotidyltransferase domain-containing protein [Prolixibacteraceae bacterium]